jgi:hypothetical protein
MSLKVLQLTTNQGKIHLPEGGISAMSFEGKNMKRGKKAGKM